MYRTISLWRGSKYKNKKGFYHRESYDSKAEIEYAMQLDGMLAEKKIKSWEKQKTIDLVVNGYLVATYRMDFVVYHLDDVIEYVEVKGFPTETFRLKWKLLEALYGNNPKYKLTIAWTGKKFQVRKIKKYGQQF